MFALDKKGKTPLDLAQNGDHDELDRCLDFLSEAMLKGDELREKNGDSFDGCGD